MNISTMIIAAIADASRATDAPGSPESHPISCSMDTVGTAGDPPASVQPVTAVTLPPATRTAAPGAAPREHWRGALPGRSTFSPADLH